VEFAAIPNAEGRAIAFDEDHFGSETQFVYQIGHRSRLNFPLLTIQEEIHDLF
jgi:hypothetical protein